MFDSQAKPALLVAIATLVLGGIGFRSAIRSLEVFLRKEPVELRLHLAALPRSLGSWRAVGEDVLLDEATVEGLGTDRYVNRTYERADGKARLMVHIAYYTGMIDAVPHIPDRCFVAAGWNRDSPLANYDLSLDYPEARDDPRHVSVQTGEPYRAIEVAHPISGRHERVHLPFGSYEIRAARFAKEDAGDRALYGGYFFIANNRLTASPSAIRALAFKPSERYAYYVKVQLSMGVPQGAPPETFLEPSAELLHDLIPYLMRCLPDWAEVERRSTAPKNGAA